MLRLCYSFLVLHSASEFSIYQFESHSRQLFIACSKNSPVVNTICIRSFLQTHEIRIKQICQLKKEIAEIKSDTTNDNEIGLAVQSYFSVRVDLMSWQLRRLERVKGIQCWWILIPLWPIFCSYYNANNPPIVNTIRIRSFCYTNMIYLYKFRLRTGGD